MRTQTVTFGDEANRLSVTISEANVLQGMQHTLLVTGAISSIQKEDGKGVDIPEGEGWAVYLVRRHVWPHCRASAVSAEGFDLTALTLELFLQLPEGFVARWEKAALELNPHWKPEAAEEPEEKKDESAPGSELTETS